MAVIEPNMLPYVSIGAFKKADYPTLSKQFKEYYRKLSRLNAPHPYAEGMGRGT